MENLTSDRSRCPETANKLPIVLVSSHHLQHALCRHPRRHALYDTTLALGLWLATVSRGGRSIILNSFFLKEDSSANQGPRFLLFASIPIM